MKFGEWISIDGKLLLIEKCVRTVPYGFLGVVFAVYLSELGFDAFRIGIVLTFTTLSSAVYTFMVSFIADRIGRKRTLIFFAFTAFPLQFLVGSSLRWNRRQHDSWRGGSWAIPLDRAGDAPADV